MEKPDKSVTPGVFEEQLRFPDGRHGSIVAQPCRRDPDNLVELHIELPDRPSTFLVVSRRFFSRISASAAGRKTKGKMFPGRFGGISEERMKEISMMGVAARRKKQGHA